jgi:hypothetical protein
MNTGAGWESALTLLNMLFQTFRSELRHASAGPPLTLAFLSTVTNPDWPRYGMEVLFTTQVVSVPANRIPLPRHP